MRKNDSGVRFGVSILGLILAAIAGWLAGNQYPPPTTDLLQLAPYMLIALMAVVLVILGGK